MTFAEQDDGRGGLKPMLGSVSAPEELRTRVLRTVEAVGSANSPPKSTARRSLERAMIAAAAVFLFWSGLATGRMRPVDVTGNGQPLYAILLYHETNVDDVAEHVRWVTQLAKSGRTITGEKLADRVVPVDNNAPGNERVLGFFVVSASDDDDAARTARTIPHYRNGGRIVVRPIEPVSSGTR